MIVQLKNTSQALDFPHFFGKKYAFGKFLPPRLLHERTTLTTDSIIFTSERDHRDGLKTQLRSIHCCSYTLILRLEYFNKGNVLDSRDQKKSL
jgi:hypothetical protein